MNTPDAVSEKRADEDAKLLGVLHRHLAGDGIRSRIYKRMRLAIGTQTIPPSRAYAPTELIVYDANGRGQAKVTIRVRFWGTAFLVTPSGDRPIFQFPISQISEVIHWLTLLTRSESEPRHATRPERPRRPPLESG
ncbi:hypothetical protein DQ384_03660 [Sphaerisporangium album]|uniref:Uncharacterized protein n=1 Tax=Sphaerisporangium album TaxID=509200 RepID=A0A367FSD2_9ACTN|nr:hypothetical protein [Sphaerisporangium album]RCG32600.1 hypothetical protein DQ384_03660 [Sphaerisporangium album]